VPSAFRTVVPLAPFVTLVTEGALVPGSLITITPASAAMLIANTREIVSSTRSWIGGSGSCTVAATRSEVPSMMVSVRSIALPT
jgi:hypothetical protein